MTHEQIIQVLQEFSVETDHGYYELHGILFDSVAGKIMKLSTSPVEVTDEMIEEQFPPTLERPDATANYFRRQGAKWMREQITRKEQP